MKKGAIETPRSIPGRDHIRYDLEIDIDESDDDEDEQNAIMKRLSTDPELIDNHA
jgi:hypothetical protein